MPRLLPLPPPDRNRTRSVRGPLGEGSSRGRTDKTLHRLTHGEDDVDVDFVFIELAKCAKDLHKALGTCAESTTSACDHCVYVASVSAEAKEAWRHLGEMIRAERPALRVVT